MLNVIQVQELIQEAQQFTVTDLNSADWALEKLQELNAQIKEKQEFAQTKIDKINTWLINEVEKLTDQKGYFEGLLIEYALEQRRINPKFKISVPAGKVTFRKQQPKWNYDEETLLESLKRSKIDNLIRIKEEINKAELKKVAQVVNGQVLIDGEFIEGVEVLEQDEAIKIEVSE